MVLHCYSLMCKYIITHMALSSTNDDDEEDCMLHPPTSTQWQMVGGIVGVNLDGLAVVLDGLAVAILLVTLRNH